MNCTNRSRWKQCYVKKYIGQNCCNSCRGELATANRNHWQRHGAMAWHLTRPEVKGSANNSIKQNTNRLLVLHGMQCLALLAAGFRRLIKITCWNVRASSGLVLQNCGQILRWLKGYWSMAAGCCTDNLLGNQCMLKWLPYFPVAWTNMFPVLWMENAFAEMITQIQWQLNLPGLARQWSSMASRQCNDQMTMENMMIDCESTADRWLADCWLMWVHCVSLQSHSVIYDLRKWRMRNHYV